MVSLQTCMARSQSPFGCFHRWDGVGARNASARAVIGLNRLSAASTGGTEQAAHPKQAQGPVSIAFRLLPPVGRDAGGGEEGGTASGGVSIAFRLLPPVGHCPKWVWKAINRSVRTSQSPFGCFHRWDRRWSRRLPRSSGLNRLSAASTGGTLIADLPPEEAGRPEVSIAFRLLPPVGHGRKRHHEYITYAYGLNRLSAASTGGT